MEVAMTAKKGRFVVDGEHGAELFSVLLAVARSFGITVTIEETLPSDYIIARYKEERCEKLGGEGVSGFWWPSRQWICILRANQAQMTHALLHELAHSIDPDTQEYVSDEALHEVECVAELAACWAGKYASFDTHNATAQYIAYLGKELEEDRLALIVHKARKVAQDLIRGIDDVLAPYIHYEQIELPF